MLLLLGAALGVVAATVRDHRVAQSAADLSALGGAAALRRGEDGCAAAAGLARDNGAEVVDCRVVGADLVVSVSVPGPGWLGQTGDLTATARAGPGPRPGSLVPAGGVAQQQVQQVAGALLVQRVVLVAALG